MKQFVEIINCDAVIYTDTKIEGISASSEEWKKYNIYPNNGVVAQVLGEGAYQYGKFLVLQCLDGFFVTILPHGVKYISESEFWERLPQNLIVSTDINQKNKTSMVDSIMREMLKNIGG